MTRSFRPQTFEQASRRKHTRHGRHYDPESEKKQQGPWVAIAAVFGMLVIAGAGFFAYRMFEEKAARERAEAERPIRSAKLLTELKQFRMANASDDKIDQVSDYLTSRLGDLEDRERLELAQILVSLKEQKAQATLNKEIKDLLAKVQGNMDDPRYAEQVDAWARDLERKLNSLDEDRAAEVKKTIFDARGRTAIAAARAAMKKADQLALEKPGEFSAIMAAYEKASDPLATDLVANKQAETKEIRDEIAMKLDRLAEKWGSSPVGWDTARTVNLLDPKQFAPLKGDEKAPWQASPGAKLSWDGAKLVIEGVKPTTPQKPGERAGIVLWTPSPTQGIRHYELKLRVKILKRGFTLCARQASGYARHLYGLESTVEGEKRDDSSFYPEEGHTYDVLERVYGRIVHVEVTPLSGDDVLPAAFDDKTNATEGGIGFQLRIGSKIEIERAEVRILR